MEVVLVDRVESIKLVLLETLTNTEIPGPAIRHCVANLPTIMDVYIDFQ